MNKKMLTGIAAGLGMLMLILDTKTALHGASEGISLCLRVVVPSLFPFVFLSILLTNTLLGSNIHLLSPIGRLLGIESGSEALVLAGLLGGYPVGAQGVAQAVRCGCISRENGKRMLAFCSNAGPSFIFGIGSSLFEEKWMCWALWFIHIYSALIVGIIMPGRTQRKASGISSEAVSPVQALSQAAGVMTSVCGWIVICKVLLRFMQHWFLWAVPIWMQCLITGLTELANGCCSLAQIDNTEIRFVLFSIMLGFGGVCVVMQTYAVTEGMDASMYLPGKLTQTIVSAILAAAVISREIPWIFLSFTVSILAAILLQKKTQIRDSILRRIPV